MNLVFWIVVWSIISVLALLVDLRMETGDSIVNVSSIGIVNYLVRTTNSDFYYYILLEKLLRSAL